MNTKKQINIFIVEDSKVFTVALKADIENAFENIPIEVHIFETGEKCMEKFKGIKPQVVILDYHLNSKYPDAMDGIKVLNWIKMENPDTYIIMLTSEDNIDVALKSFNHGAFDYVVKTETTFGKINFSLFNLFKIMEAKREAKKYRYFLGIFICLMTLLIAGAIAVQVYAPSIFNK